MNVGATTSAAKTIEELVAQGVKQQSLGQEDFLSLMLTQLQNQNPLEPLDDQEFINQITQFNILDQTTAFNDSLANLYQFQATALIGKTVEGTTLDGQTLTGVVKEVVISEGQATLILEDDTTLQLDNVTRVLASDEAADAA